MNPFYMEKIVALLTEMRDSLKAAVALLERPAVQISAGNGGGFADPRTEAERHFKSSQGKRR